MPGATADCERITASFLGQPVNTLTCLAFLFGAALIWSKRRDLPTTLLVAGVGLGSIAFHGPMPPGAGYLHDVTIVWALTWVALSDLSQVRWWPPAFVVGAASAGTSALADPGQAVLVTAVVLIELRSPGRRGERLLTLTFLGIGAVIGRLAASGGPLCRPNSIWQGHGLWHLAAATALTFWALVIRALPEPAK